jgi:asparagine synthase (glutamine-hydrolysing)
VDKLVSLTCGSWKRFGKISLKGYLLESPCDISKLAEAGFSEAAFVDWLKRANGCFAMVYQDSDILFAAVDRIRSYPLFFTNLHSLADCSENLDPLRIEHLHTTQKNISSEFLICGFVSGKDTLHPDIFQIPAGHYLLMQKGQAPQLRRYYSYQHEEIDGLAEHELCVSLHKVHLGVAQRLIAHLDGRPAVIPLSGGWDSRLIAYLLKQAGYPAIYTFSYEAKNNPESRISQKVAKHLGLPWFFIEHTHNSWYRAYFSAERKQHYKYAVNAVSSAHIQDWLAVKELKRQQLIPPNSVFIPGHTGDFLQSGHLPPGYHHQKHFTQDELVNQIIARHYRLWSKPSMADIRAFSQRILSCMDTPQMMPACEAANYFEYWELQERQAKFIVNSVRVYEDLAYSWALPLWDSQLMDFWAKVPLKLRLDRKLWHTYQALYLPIPVPVFKNLSVPTRLRNKLLRIAFGEITDTRYGRFAPYLNFRQYSAQKVKSYLREDFEYPGFIDPERPLIRCDMNALQALRAIYEL